MPANSEIFLDGSSLDSDLKHSVLKLGVDLAVVDSLWQSHAGEFPEASEQGRFIKRQIREVAGQSGSVKTSAMVRRNQRDAKR